MTDQPKKILSANTEVRIWIVLLSLAIAVMLIPGILFEFFRQGWVNQEFIDHIAGFTIPLAIGGWVFGFISLLGTLIVGLRPDAKISGMNLFFIFIAFVIVAVIAYSYTNNFAAEFKTP